MSVFITGASGLVGRALIKKLVKEKIKTIALIRKPDPSLPKSSFVHYFIGDLADKQTFKFKIHNLKTVIHCAANTRFNQSKDEAQKNNLDATQNLISWIKSYSKQPKLAYLSTLYSAGAQIGAIKEDIHPENIRFVNFYEWSKYNAEKLVQASGLDYSIFRLATIIAEDESGTVSQKNAFHNTLRLLESGLLSFLPAKKETPLYLSTTKFCVEALFHLCFKNWEKAGVYHLCESIEDSLKVKLMIEKCHGYFGKYDPKFKKKNILPPVLTELDAFNHLVKASGDFVSPITNHVMGTVTPFAEQLSLGKDFKNSKTKKQLGAQFHWPNIDKTLENTIAYLSKNKTQPKTRISQ